MAVAAQPSAGGCGTYLESFPGPAPSAAHSSDHTAHVCNLEAPAHLHGGPAPRLLQPGTTPSLGPLQYDLMATSSA